MNLINDPFNPCSQQELEAIEQQQQQWREANEEHQQMLENALRACLTHGVATDDVQLLCHGCGCSWARVTGEPQKSLEEMREDVVQAAKTLIKSEFSEGETVVIRVVTNEPKGERQC